MRPVSSIVSRCSISAFLVLAVGVMHAEDFLEFGENLAQFGVPAQSSQLGGFDPARALDGNFGNFTHTQNSADLPGPAWWEVDLLDESEIGFIAICNRTSCCGSRLRDIVVEIRDADGEVIWATTDVEDPDPDALLNPENAQGTFPLGPTSIFVDVIGLNGGNPVSGQIIRVNRLPDSDLSGSGGQGNNDEATVLQIGEFGAFEDSPCDEEEGDSHCLSVEAEGPTRGDFPGPWTFTVTGEDDSGDLLSVRVTAEHTDGTVVSGGSDTDQVVLDLPLEGTWTVSASVDDSLVCSDEADDASCKIQVEVVNSDVAPVENLSCGFDDDGNVELTWNNPGGGRNVVVTVQGEEVENLGADAEGVVIDAGDLPAEDPLQVCIDNGANLPRRCLTLLSQPADDDSGKTSA